MGEFIRKGWRGLTETERNWVRSAAIVAGAIAVFAVVYSLEMESGRWNERRRLVYEPSESATRFIGIPHFLVALFFVATSRAMRRWKPRLSLLATAPLAVVLCVFYGALQSWSPVLGGALFYSVFLLHVFRDEAFFYFCNGDGRGPQRELTALFFWCPVAVVASAAVAIEAALVARLVSVARLDALVSAAGPAAVVAIGAVAPAVVAGSVWRIRASLEKAGIGSLSEIMRAHAPIFRVLGGDILVFGADLALTGQGYAIVILHFAEWYVFTMRGLRKRAGGARDGGFVAWIRSTAPGFRLLHVGLVVGMVLAGVIWTYAFADSPRLSVFRLFLDRGNFPYWTIAHVAASVRGR